MIGFELNISFNTFMPNTFFKPYRFRVHWENNRTPIQVQMTELGMAQKKTLFTCQVNKIRNPIILTVIAFD